MPRLSTKVQKFEGWHYDAFAGVVPRRRVHGRDLGKTLSRPIVTFESIDSISPFDVHGAHFPSATSTTPSIISIAAQEFPRHLSSNDVSLISDDSSIDDSTYLLSCSSAFSLPLVPTGVGLGILGLTRKEGEGPFDGLGLVHLNRSSRDISSDDELSHTILREAALTFMQPSIPVGCFEIDDIIALGHSEPEKTRPVDMPSPRNRPRRSLTRNLSASTVSSSLKRASKPDALSKLDRGRSWRL
ncbi:hypothetical protein IW261DRAFT_1520140 [Armillaria novae-zelandiae]|uniref:Uncharacterized protein n=1 Tax=Armillaria novae-zelandiae TaxID=153914 RepID=A0AA39NKZ8_9AGAR|nr:hypothetical protein IW261DRAFT_1520140 [Armillaria novae-zelandiae]